MYDISPLDYDEAIMIMLHVVKKALFSKAALIPLRFHTIVAGRDVEFFPSTHALSQVVRQNPVVEAITRAASATGIGSASSATSGGLIRTETEVELTGNM